MDFQELDIMFWVKFIGCFIVFCILPVWVWSFVELGFTMKFMFTIAGAVGVFIALNGKSIRLHS